MDYKTSKTGINLIGDAHYLPLRDKSISKTLCKSVLEHVQSPYKVLLETKRVTEGSIIVWVPNIIHIKRIIKTILNPFYWINFETTHFQAWDSKNIRHLAYFVGLIVQSITWKSISPHWLKRFCRPLLCSHMVVTLHDPPEGKCDPALCYCPDCDTGGCA